MGKLWKLLLGIPAEEVGFARRGFHARDPGAKAHLERVGRAFLQGYHRALQGPEPERLVADLEAAPNDLRGFTYEGAAMGLGVLDRLTPWRRDRWLRFVRGPGASHVYMAHVGLGWVVARFGGRIGLWWERLDPLLRWLVLDGYGFHEGYFHWRRTIVARAIPRQLTGYAVRAFDQGLGRSLWFVCGADALRLGQAIRAFAAARQADLWGGAGLACAYAGGAAEPEIRSLARLAGSFRPQLAQGAAFGAKARQRAGNCGSHTETACLLLCGMRSARAALLTDEALENLAPEGNVPAYEVWRQRVQARWAGATCHPS
jgi:hypothetical protein